MIYSVKCFRDSAVATIKRTGRLPRALNQKERKKYIFVVQHVMNVAYTHEK